MLRSFMRHFNETVFRGPDMEGSGGDEDVDVLDRGGPSDDGGAAGDGDITPQEEERPLTVREELKKAIAESSEQQQPKKKTDKSGRFGDRQQPSKETQQIAPQAPAVGAVPAPEHLPKEAKAEWDKTPVAVQNAFIKREQDMARGVAELKQRYDLIDQAVAPHTDALRQMNATPADAVNRMFLWFKALAGTPAVAFPELAKSMGIDWQRLVAAHAQRGQQNAPNAGQGTQNGAPDIPEPVRNYMTGLEQQLQRANQQLQQFDSRFGSLEQNINAQNFAKTNENLMLWSKDKKYFEDVRQDMARLIEKQIIPLKEDGQVDLDTAYERAIYFNPEVRAKVLAEQQQANQEVQQKTTDAATIARQANVDRARKASVSLPANSGPGAPRAPTQKKKTGPTSVRESLRESIAQLRDQ